MIPDEFMWAVGLFEGEGCITLHSQRHPRLLLQVRTTDLDVLERFHRIVGSVGTLTGPYFRAQHKPYWNWAATGRDAETLLRRLLPELGARRRERGLELLEKCVPGEHIDQLRIQVGA